MEVLILLIGGPVLAGIVIALYERRTQTTLLKHDLSLAPPQSEADRESERAAQVTHQAHQRTPMHPSDPT